MTRSVTFPVPRRLAQHLPCADSPPTREDARAFCRQLAQTHYENFTVASWLLPREIRPHFYAIYSYCRWADDLADEAPSPEDSLQLLDEWEASLRDCYAGTFRHPIFVALSETIQEYAIPAGLFCDLLIAFRQDQQIHRYANAADVLSYCRYSANPVGRLILHLARQVTPAAEAWSDHVCTGLQLANFCQDVARDWDRGRIYLPEETWRRHGYTEEDFRRRVTDDRFRAVLEEEVARAEGHLLAGRPLVAQLPRAFAVDVGLFIEGGLAILRAIRRQRYDVWSRRPTVGKGRKLSLLARTWFSVRCGRYGVTST